MSAYIVSNETISVIAKGFFEYGVTYKAEGYYPILSVIMEKREIINNIGQSLLNQNYASVNYRYNENAEMPIFDYTDVDIDEGVVYGCIKEYDYQACETDDYFESDLHASLIRLQEKLLERLLKREGLKAPYGYGSFDILE